MFSLNFIIIITIANALLAIGYFKMAILCPFKKTIHV